MTIEEFTKVMMEIVKQNGLALFSEAGRRNEVFEMISTEGRPMPKPHRDALQKCLDQKFHEALRSCKNDIERLECKRQYEQMLQENGTDATIARDILNALEFLVDSEDKINDF
jgi:hypothetical protein